MRGRRADSTSLFGGRPPSIRERPPAAQPFASGFARHCRISNSGDACQWNPLATGIIKAWNVLHYLEAQYGSEDAIMADAREIALSLLPIFQSNVLARRRLTYGFYARAIGLDPATDAPAIGPPMHAIGAACVLANIPVAPLYYVKRADRESARVFESNDIERRHVQPHRGILYVAAREYSFTADEFHRVERGLRDVIPRVWSPHRIWETVIFGKPRDKKQTYLERMLETCLRIIESARKRTE